MDFTYFPSFTAHFVAPLLFYWSIWRLFCIRFEEIVRRDMTEDEAEQILACVFHHSTKR